MTGKLRHGRFITCNLRRGDL